MEMLILLYTNEGDLIIDQTAGTGTTAVAALKWGRKCIGIEIDEALVHAANDRIDKARAAIEQNHWNSPLLK